MNYIVKCDGELLYNEYSDDCYIIDDDVNLSANEIGSFTFSLNIDHPLYDSIELKKSKIKIYKDDVLKMIFRPIEQHDDLSGIRTFYCEGCLTYFKDSLMRPFDFGGAPSLLFHNIIQQHNSQVNSYQQFVEGVCTVTDPNNYVVRSSVSYSRTWDTIVEKMLSIGGYLVITFDQNENPVLNWLGEITTVCSQPIVLGENLTSYERSLIYSDFCTACVPLGAQNVDGSRLTIEEENNGQDYIVNQQLASVYGMIYANPDDTTWDDVTIASNLLTKGRKWLDESGVKYKKNITLTAEDISFLKEYGLNVDSFEFMEKVPFKNSSGQSVEYIIAKFNFSLSNKYRVNVELVDESFEYVERDFTLISNRNNKVVGGRLQNIEENKVNTEQIIDAINELGEDNEIVAQSFVGMSGQFDELQAEYAPAVINQRCWLSPIEVGWYRVYKWRNRYSAANDQNDAGIFCIDIDVMIPYAIDLNYLNSYCNHFIKLNVVKGLAFFDCELSRGNALIVDKIRFVKDTNVSLQNNIYVGDMYVDIHIASVPDDSVYCVFDLKARDKAVNSWFETIRRTTKVDDTPSGETIVNEYTFLQNGFKVNGKCYINGDSDISGNVDVSGTATVSGAFNFANAYSSGGIDVKDVNAKIVAFLNQGAVGVNYTDYNGHLAAKLALDYWTGEAMLQLNSTSGNDDIYLIPGVGLRMGGTTLNESQLQQLLALI